jgi:hypothetical protein
MLTKPGYGRLFFRPDDDGAGGAGGDGESEDGGNGKPDSTNQDDGGGEDGAASALRKEREARRAAERDLKAAKQKLKELETAGTSATSEAEALKGQVTAYGLPRPPATEIPTDEAP